MTEPSISIWQCALYILLHVCVFTLLFTRFKMVSADFADGVTHPRVSTDALYFLRTIITHQSHVICHTFLSCSAWRKSAGCFLSFWALIEDDSAAPLWRRCHGYRSWSVWEAVVVSKCEPWACSILWYEWKSISFSNFSPCSLAYKLCCRLTCLNSQNGNI